jgi:hypothetical protein
MNALFKNAIQNIHKNPEPKIADPSLTKHTASEEVEDSKGSILDRVKKPSNGNSFVMK